MVKSIQFHLLVIKTPSTFHMEYCIYQTSNQRVRQCCSERADIIATTILIFSKWTWEVNLKTELCLFWWTKSVDCKVIDCSLCKYMDTITVRVRSLEVMVYSGVMTLAIDYILMETPYSSQLQTPLLSAYCTIVHLSTLCQPFSILCIGACWFMSQKCHLLIVIKFQGISQIMLWVFKHSRICKALSVFTCIILSICCCILTIDSFKSLT